MAPLEPLDIAGYVGGASVVVTFFVWAFRRGWQQLTGAYADTSKAAADATVFNNLREEVTRMGLDIKQLKLDHRAEKLELENRIADLEAKVLKLTFRLGSVRKAAIDAYSKLISSKVANDPDVHAAIEDIKIILEED